MAIACVKIRVYVFSSFKKLKMGKKSDKAKEKSATSGHHENAEDSNKSPGKNYFIVTVTVDNITNSFFIKLVS